MYYMNLPDIIHASESSCLFIRIIADSLKQHRGVSWGICFSCSTSPPICLCLLCSVICPSVHSSPPHIHPTAHSISHGPFCPLISFDTSVLIFIHVIGLFISQSQRGTEDLNPFGHCWGDISAAFSSNSQVTSNRSWPLTLCIWWMRMSLQMTSRPEWHWLRPADIWINCAKIKGVFISPDHYWLDTKAQRWISDTEIILTVSRQHLYLYTWLYYAQILESIVKSLI